MKKKLLMLLSIMVLSSTVNFAYSKTNSNSDLAYAIKLYKAGNYTECYSKLNDIIRKDGTNPYAYYYLAMTDVRIGKKEEAIANYERAISLTSQSNRIHVYAQKGKRCIEDPEKCQDPISENALDEFIQGMSSHRDSEQVKSDYERLQIEQLKRDINKYDNIEPSKLRDFKDFSSMNDVTPTNDEIVAALRVLQKAGLNNTYGSDMSLFTGYNAEAQMLNMLGNSGMSPQMIQAMFTNNMSLGF